MAWGRGPVDQRPRLGAAGGPPVRRAARARSAALGRPAGGGDVPAVPGLLPHPPRGGDVRARVQAHDAARPFGPNPRSFGHFGTGGAVGFADPDAGVAFGYVMNDVIPRWQSTRNRSLIGASTRPYGGAQKYKKSAGTRPALPFVPGVEWKSTPLGAHALTCRVTCQAVPAGGKPKRGQP